jgi:glycerol-3-phosphate dehydrogenase
MRNLKGCFEYYDGLMDDIRLVIDNIVSARLAGALCLNYVKATRIGGQKGNKFVIVRDTLSCKEQTITAKVVINCAGPWVRQIEGLPVTPSTPSLRYSQGTHLLFTKLWNAPSLFLPLEEKGRYYFVWPHSEGTLVGTTEREISEIPSDPQPLADEIEEILFRLSRDLPHAELNRSSLSYCFAGIRTLPVKKRRNGTKTSELSRKHIWEYSDGVLSLFGGKYTTAYWTAFEGLKIIWQSLGRTNKPHSLKSIPLEATATLSNLPYFHQRAQSLGISDHLIKLAGQRMGGNVRYFANNLHLMQPLTGDVALNGEVDWAFSIEQATSLRDVMRRRLGIEFRKDHGLSALDQICSIGAKYLPNHNFKLDIQNYQEAMNRLHTLMGITQTNHLPC